MPSNNLPRDCRFFGFCGASPIGWVDHSHLGRIAACQRCIETNPYISEPHESSGAGEVNENRNDNRASELERHEILKAEDGADDRAAHSAFENEGGGHQQYMPASHKVNAPLPPEGPGDHFICCA